MIINWNEAYVSGRDYRVMNELLLGKILTRAGGESLGEALDIGCGTGDLAVKIAKRGYAVTGLDLSDVAVKKAQERSAGSGVADKTKFLTCNIEDPEQAGQLAEKKYRLVSCKLVFAFVKDKKAFLGWVKNHLTDGGAFILITPVLHAGITYEPRLQNISVDYELLMGLLHDNFDGVREIHTEYFDEWGDERTFVLS